MNTSTEHKTPLQPLTNNSVQLQKTKPPTKKLKTARKELGPIGQKSKQGEK